MKKIVSFLTIIILLLSVCLMGCDGCQDTVVPSNFDGKEYAIDAVTGKTLMLVENRTSDYVIVIPKDAHSVEKHASEEMQLFVYEATGTTLEVVSDDEVEISTNDKAILVGDTRFSESVETLYTVLGDSGFKMHVNGNNIVLKGATPEGSLYAVYQFLSEVLNFEVYSHDEYYIDTVSSVKVVKLDNVTDIPAIDYRNAGWGITAVNDVTRMRLIGPSSGGVSVYGKDWGVAVHAIEWFVSPKLCQGEQYEGWFPNGHICMTMGDRKNPDGTLMYPDGDPIIEFLVNGTQPDGNVNANNLMGKIIGSPVARIFELGHPDDNSSCECESCMEGREKWGGISGVYMRWINKVCYKLEEEFEKRGIERDITVLGLMYHAYENPFGTISEDGTVTLDGTATTEEKNAELLAKNTGHVRASVRYAPITACYSHAFTDPNCDINVRGKYADKFRIWRYICRDNKMFMYGYNGEFYDYFFYFNDLGYMNEQYKFLGEEIDLYGAFDSTISRNGNAPFSALAVYLKSKLMWNPDLDTKTLIDNFYANYFKAAGPYMKELFDGVRLHFAELNVKLGAKGCYGYNKIGAYYMEPANWPVDLLFEFQESIDKAWEALENAGYDQETYEKIYWRIKCDETFTMHWFVNNYSSSFSADELAEMQKDFDKTREHFSMIYSSH
ncbi:MAG: DUF4838 domain-containing protein [Clostridia bacterium]|nr:DUF4838 domain-containing protein [Clostridia bacterium]